MVKHFLLILGLVFAISAHAGDETVATESDDPEMLAAVAVAQEHLDMFLAEYAKYKGEPTDFGVKVAFPVKARDSSHEVIWVTYFDQIGPNRFVGRLSNEPNYMPGLYLDSEVEFTRDMIQDWYIFEGNKVYGYFTVRVLLPALDAKTADEVRQSIHETPLPARFE